jgi:hypothetical protein
MPFAVWKVPSCSTFDDAAYPKKRPKMECGGEESGGSKTYNQRYHGASDFQTCSTRSYDQDASGIHSMCPDDSGYSRHSLDCARYLGFLLYAHVPSRLGVFKPLLRPLDLDSYTTLNLFYILKVRKNKAHGVGPLFKTRVTTIP